MQPAGRSLVGNNKAPATITTTTILDFDCDGQSNRRHGSCSIAKGCYILHSVRVIARLVVSTVASAVQLIGFVCD